MGMADIRSADILISRTYCDARANISTRQSKNGKKGQKYDLILPDIISVAHDQRPENTGKSGCNKGSGIVFGSVSDITEAILSKYRDNDQKYDQTKQTE